MTTIEPASVLGSRPARSPRRVSRATFVAASAVAAAVLLPAVYLVVRASGAGAGVATVLTESRTMWLLVRTTGLAAAVTGASLAIGVPLAWLTARTDLPGRRAFAVLTALPLVIPSYVGGYVFVAALGPRGIVQGWLEPLGVNRLPSIYGFWGAWLALTLFTYPYVLLTVRAAVRRLDPALEEASASLGRTRAQTFRRVIVPQLRPAAAAGGLLVALYTLHDFGAVSLLRFDSFTRAIYVSYRGSFDRSRAAVLALVLVAMALAVVVAEFRTRSRGVIYRVHGGGGRVPAVTRLGRWRWPAFGACASLVAVALVMPMSVIGYWVARSARGGGPVADTISAGVNSVQVAALAALVAAAAAWPVAFVAARAPGRASRSIERASYIGYAVPGIVVALALVFFGARYAPAIYQTLPLLVFAYVVLFLPQATGAIRASFEQVNPALEDAARSLGAPAGRVARTILFPLVRPGIAAGAALVFLTVMKELPATLLLAPTGFSTLATQVWNSTSAAFFDRAATPALALIVLSSVPLAVLMLRDREAR